jgi:tetratricopeptide (TPR) repeat protein
VDVPFRLTRRDTHAPTDAFLLLATDAKELATAGACLGANAPAVFPVRGGFVLVPPAGHDVRHVPGAIALRRLMGDLLIPADAELVPALLPDEAAALTQHRGLVVLPGGAVLGFDPQPLRVTRWLRPVVVRRDDWQPFPPRPLRPDTLSVIERPAPLAGLMDVLGAGAPDDAEPLGTGSGQGIPEDARPPATNSALTRFTASSKLAVGGFLAWVGRQFGSAGLAKLGGDLARSALEAVPRLSEKVLGDQEAALREVLRQLQSGDIEKGLRRAPAAVADPNQPARLGTDAQLGNRDTRYSLRDLIGSGGPATAWLGGGDVWNELAKVYRQLAEDATTRGDFRRAAYIYGVLLRDLRSAANVLLAGGLCRDAALLFRDRLNDPLAAADAFERAGDTDEAVRLYEKYEHFERAADLLLRIGDEERALLFHTKAAEQLARRGHFLAAGLLMRNRASRRDLALNYFRRGWEGITAENVTCGERLLDEYLAADDLPATKSLLAEAEAVLADRPSDTGRFFNYALGVGKDFLPAELRDDLSDHVRLMFASHLRTAGSGHEGSRLANELFGHSAVWSGPVVRDAGFAVREKDRRPVPPAAPTHPPPVKLASGTVTAVAVARGTFDIVVATTEVIVVCRVSEGRVVPLGDGGEEPFVAVSVDEKGSVVVALQVLSGTVQLTSFAVNDPHLLRRVREGCDDLGGDWYLQPAVADELVVVALGPRRLTLVGPVLVTRESDVFRPEGLQTHLLVSAGRDSAWDWSDESIHHLNHNSSPPDETQWIQPWKPARGDETLPAPSIDWLTPEPGTLEVTGIDTEGFLRWAEFRVNDPAKPTKRQAIAPSDGYVASCLTGPGAVAGVTRQNEVQWFRLVGTRLDVVASVKLNVPTPVVALVARPTHNEVVAIHADGHAVRVRRP